MVEKNSFKNTSLILIYFSSSDYTTFADIYRASNGFRRLVLDGYRYGELGIGHTYDANTCEKIFLQYWRCTANVYDQKTKKYKRCLVRLKTRVIDGYEMIEKTNVLHEHKRFDDESRKHNP